MTPSTISPAGSGTAGSAAVPVVEYLGALWKRKWMVLAIAIIACGATYFWTDRQPRLYEADCTIEYDPNPPRPLGRAVEDVASPMVWWESREYFATQNRIIASRAVAEKVVRKLSLHTNATFMGVPPAERARWKGAEVIEAASKLQKMITVTQERDTRLVHIQIKDYSPERAALIANAVADAYIEKTMEDRVGTTTNAVEWLGRQLDSLKNQLESSELSLHEFTEEHSNLAVSLEDQQNIVASNIEQLSRVLTETRTKRIESAARLDALRAADREDPLEVNASTILSTVAVAALRDQYRKTLTEHEALIVSYGDAHPKVVAINAQLRTLKQALRREIDGLIQGAEAELAQIEQVEKGVKQALDQANRVGVELNLQEITYRRLQRERDNTSKLYGTLLERTAQTDLTRALQVSFVRVVDTALVPTIPVSPRMRLSLALGTLLGLGFGIGLALVLEQLDRVIRTVEDAEALGVTILGIMPRIDESGSGGGPTYGRKLRKNAPQLVTNRDLIVHTHPKSSVAECCRTIRTNLMFMTAEHPQRALVVTSANPREGKTTVTLSLAISLAQSGKRVLLVDTDLRKPRIHKAFGRSNARGVTNVLVGGLSAKEAIQSSDVPNLDLLASGPIPPNPAELLHTEQFGDLVAELRRQYDHVLFDSPPLAAVTDAAIIAPQIDGVLLIVHGQKTTRDAMRSALRQLHDVGAHITGGVLNDVDLSSNRYGYGSYYYHNEGYYETDADSSRNADAPAAES